MLNFPLISSWRRVSGYRALAESGKLRTVVNSIEFIGEQLQVAESLTQSDHRGRGMFVSLEKHSLTF